MKVVKKLNFKQSEHILILIYFTKVNTTFNANQNKTNKNYHK